MTFEKLFLFVIFGLCQSICAQQDTIIPLQEVRVSDYALKNFTATKSVQVLNDSLIAKNQASLTSLLNFNSVIYFKENGLGMVSSPSFRGTTAQQTAVIWNGININSQLNGQTDFNTIGSRDYNSISVQAGGNSTIYGSSAIGGSVHLNNDLVFKKQFENELFLNYGSFNTQGLNYRIRVSDADFSSQASISRNSSDNDFGYLGTNNQRNENGQFWNTSMNANFGYKMNSHSFIKVYSQFFQSERHFSGTLAAPSRSKYEDLNSRNLIEWDQFFGRFTSKVKLAFLSEEYKYFENATTTIFETARAETLITKYDLKYQLDSNTNLNALIDFTNTKGIGSQIGINNRSIAAAVLVLKKRFFQDFLLELSLRKELTSNYESPFLYATGIKYEVSNQYNLKLNLSRNFRIPTFNDLYWQGSGSAILKPESATQIELGQELKTGKFTLSATAYYSKIKDLLQWTPVGSIWSPVNVGNVRNYGLEFYGKWIGKIGEHHFNLNSSYAYTISRDDYLGRQLIYVPFHKFNTDLNYSFRKLSTNYQLLFNGSVFTPSQKFNIVKEYFISNLGIYYALGSSESYKIGFQVLNIWNENYQMVSLRPMPGRNYMMNLTFKF